DQTPSPRNLACPQAFGVDLASQVDLHRGVDRHHIRNGTDAIGVVGIFDRMEFDPWVAVDEVIESLGAPAETGHHLACINIFPGTVDTATLNEIDHPVSEQLGVDAQLLALREAFCYCCWDCAATDLETITVPNQRCHIGSELTFDIGDHGARIFRKWIVSLN